jgi:hypothetical protein
LVSIGKPNLVFKLILGPFSQEKNIRLGGNADKQAKNGRLFLIKIKTAIQMDGLGG